MTQQQHWASKQERGGYLAIRCLLTLYKYGGKFLLQIALVPILLYFFLRDSIARNASLDYLQRLHTYSGEQSPFSRRPGYGLAYCHFWQFARSALAKIDAWLGRLDSKQVYYGGSVGFEQIMQQNQGAVLIGSHLGNLEVCRALVRSKYPVKINVLAHTRHAAAFNRILKESNSSVDMELIEVTELTPAVSAMLSDCIARGELVVIVGDRISAQAPERAIWVDFLGKPAPFAIGPWVLASVLECPVYLIFCLQQNKGYNLMFEPFATQLQLPRKTRQLALQNIVQRYARHLEQIARRYPLQWFNFYDFWQLPALNKKKESSGDSSA